MGTIWLLHLLASASNHRVCAKWLHTVLVAQLTVCNVLYVYEIRVYYSVNRSVAFCTSCTIHDGYQFLCSTSISRVVWLSNFDCNIEVLRCITSAIQTEMPNTALRTYVHVHYVVCATELKAKWFSSWTWGSYEGGGACDMWILKHLNSAGMLLRSAFVEDPYSLRRYCWSDVNWSAILQQCPVRSVFKCLRIDDNYCQEFIVGTRMWNSASYL